MFNLFLRMFNPNEKKRETEIVVCHKRNSINWERIIFLIY